MKTPPHSSFPLNRRAFLKSIAIGYAATGTVATLAAGDELSSVDQKGAKLPQRPLGKTGLTVSALALGGVIGMQLPPSAEHDPMALAGTALNPLKKVLRPYHDETAHQVGASSLIRYTLSLPISVAVIGVASVEQLKANIRIVSEAAPITLAQRQELESAMG
jgi:hypothetical protein